jgi:hypothetical protein
MISRNRDKERLAGDRLVTWLDSVKQHASVLSAADGKIDAAREKAGRTRENDQLRSDVDRLRSETRAQLEWKFTSPELDELRAGLGGIDAAGTIAVGSLPKTESSLRAQEIIRVFSGSGWATVMGGDGDCPGRQTHFTSDGGAGDSVCATLPASHAPVF